MSTTAAETTAVNDMCRSAPSLMLSDAMMWEALCSMFLYLSVLSCLVVRAPELLPYPKPYLHDEISSVFL